MKNLKWIALAALIVILVAGATGAAAYNAGKQAGVTEALAARNNFFQARGGGAAAQGGAAGGAAAQGNGSARSGQGGAAATGNFAAGQVKSINGNNLEISTATDVTKVKLTDKTQIQKTVSGTPSDITTGERVVVQGTKGADGVVEANSIQLGAGRFGGPGGAQGQGGQ
jgi:hypothetical protein